MSTTRDLRIKLILDTLDKASGPLKNVNKASQRTGQMLKAAREQLKQLQKQQGDISTFIKLRKATKDNNAQLKAAQAEAKRLAQQFNATETPTKKLTREFERARAAVNKLDAAHKAERAQLQKLRSSLGDAGINTRNLGTHQRDLTQRTSAATEAIKQQKAQLEALAAQQKRQQALTAKLNRVRNRGVAVGAGGAVAAYGGQRMLGGLANMLMPGVAYGEQMSAVQAVTRLDKNDPRFKMLEAQAKAFGASTSYTATEVGGGQEFLGRAGFSPAAIKASMGDILNLAKANRTEMARAADISSNIAGAFKIDPEAEGSMRRVGDILTATSTRANVNLEMLGETMKYLGQAEGLNLSLEQAAAMAGLMGNIGIQGSQAGTTLRAMLTRLAAPTNSAAGVIQELGLQTTDAAGNLRQIPDILADIASKTSRMGNAQRASILKEIFGEEPGSGMAELIGQQGLGGITKFANLIQNAAGENAKVAAIMADNLGGDLKGLASAWESVNINIAESNNGPLRQLVTRITDITRAVSDWMTANPQLTASLVQWLAIAAGVVTVLGAIGIAAGAAMLGFAAIAKMLLPLISALRIVGALLLGNPIGLAIAAIATAAYLIWQNWGPIKDFFVELWAKITATFEQFVGYLGALKDRMTSAGREMINGLIGGISGKLGELKSTITGAASAASDWFKQKLGIRSPSRVFVQHGSDVMAGLEKGLGDNRNTLRPMLDTAKRLTAAGAGLALGTMAMNATALDTRPPLQAAGSNSAQASLSIGEIHVHAAPGMNEQQLARLVAQEIAKLHANQGAARRSRLADED